MVDYLTFDSSVTCTVNGTSVSSGYELHDGDVIVVSASSAGGTISVNSDAGHINGETVDVYDKSISVSYIPASGGADSK